MPQDDEDSGLPTTAAAVTVNTPPVVHSVSISPAEPSVSDTLICDVGLITDADSDPTTHTVGWSVNGIDVGVAEPSLEASWFARGDEVQCVVTPHDGREPGLERISAEVVIQNSLPLITEVALSPLTATTNTRLNADVAAFDADADTLTLEFTWFVNGDPVTETSASLDGLVYFSRDDEVHLSVTAFDGFGISAPLETTPIVIGNSVPSAPTLRITPEEPAAGVESLTCVLDAPAVDDDGDDVAYTFTWLRDGEVFGATTDTTHEGDTVPGHVTWAGEEWTCLVSAADDISTSEEAIDAVVPEWRFTGWGDEPFPVVDGDVHLLGTNSLAAAGRAIATAGDIDGDGMLDMLIGAPQDDSRAGSSGRAYLALSSHFVGSSTATLNDAYRIIEGSAGDDHVGSSVAGGLDLAGSEAPDIVIGAYGADIMATDDGAVAVFWDGGPASPELLTFDDADVLLHGEIENEIAGVSMHVLEDMDGDGSHELLVGAPHNNTGGHRSGTAYLVLGSTMTTSGTLDLGEQTKLYGESGLDIAGTSVHSAGDLDMDGIPDIVVSAPYNETGGARAGRVYVVYGNDALTYSSLTLGDADIRIHGAAAYDEAGLGLAGGHDVDGDGSPELLIGAPYHDDPAEDAGRAYLFWGAGLAALETRSVEEADVVFTSEEPGSELGFSISSSSDVDADGLHEVVIGVPVGTGDTVGAGVTLLFMGEWLAAGGVFSPGDASYTFVGTGGNDHAGRVVLGTGDVDGDGFDDLAISEPFDTTIYGSKSGAVHLLFAP